MLCAPVACAFGSEKPSETISEPTKAPCAAPYEFRCEEPVPTISPQMTLPITSAEFAKPCPSGNHASRLYRVSLIASGPGRVERYFFQKRTHAPLAIHPTQTTNHFCFTRRNRNSAQNAESLGPAIDSPNRLLDWQSGPTRTARARVTKACPCPNSQRPPYHEGRMNGTRTSGFRTTLQKTRSRNAA